MAKATCSARNCTRVESSRGWCKAHHTRWLKYGDIQEDKPIAPYRKRGTAGTCTVDGCGQRSRRRLCAAHEARRRTSGDVQAGVPVQRRGVPRTPAECSVEDCSREQDRRTFCSGHYYRWYRTGDPGPASLRPPRFKKAPGSICTVAGCGREENNRGWCKAHYSRWQRSGDVRADEPIALPLALQMPRVCAIDGCNRLHFGKTWCFIHYQRWRRTGNPLGQQPFRLVDPRYEAIRARHRDMMAKTTKSERRIARSYREAISKDPCLYCGEPSAHADHYYPVSRGGSYLWWALVPACAKCNQTKHARCGTWFALQGGPDRIARTFHRALAATA